MEQMILLNIAVFSTLLFIIQIALMFIGVEFDIGDDIQLEIEDTSAFKFFSLQTVLA